MKMGGFIFRTGVRLKVWGERLKWNWLVQFGLSIRELALQHGKIK
jgi:hypothetical protein